MPPAVALLNYISCGLFRRIFFQTGTFRGVFSTYNWYHRILPHTVIFCGFFSFYCSPKLWAKLRCEGRGSGDIIFYSLSRRGIIVIVYLEYQSVGPIVGIGSPHTLIRKWMCLPPRIQREGEQHSLAVEGVGGPNSHDWIEGLALCILSGLDGRVERKKPFTRAARVR